MKRRAERALESPRRLRPQPVVARIDLAPDVPEPPVVFIDITGDDDETEAPALRCSVPHPSMLRFEAVFALGGASDALIARVVRLSEDRAVAMKWAAGPRPAADLEREARIHAEVQERCGGPRGSVLPLLEWCSADPGLPMFSNPRDVRAALGRRASFWTRPSAYLLLPLVTGTAESAPSITAQDAEAIDAVLRTATHCMTRLRLVHGDIRLANVFYLESGPRRRWWLGDFGAAYRERTVAEAARDNEASVRECMKWIVRRREAGRRTKKF